MKILLVYPPFYRFIGYYNRYFPLGLAYLASMAKAAGHEVLLLNADINEHPDKMNFARLEDSYPAYLSALKNDTHPVWLEMRDKIASFRPDVVGITVWTTFAASAFKTAELCKRINPAIKVVMGGPHISIKSDEVMAVCPHVDFLVKGEAELSFPELLGVISSGAGPAELENVKGIAYRADGCARHTPPRPFMGDLSGLPLPARDLLWGSGYYDSEDMGLIMASRGCPYGCSYCATSIWQRKVRYRPLQSIMAEIAHVAQRYGTSHFTFKDDSFTVDRRRVEEFCRAVLICGLNITWDCNARVDLLDLPLLKTMRKAGCTGVKIGIESGSGRILRLMDKGINKEQCRQAARLLKTSGMHWTGYFMIGLPTEAREEMLETLEFMHELDPDYASLSVYEPFPGTALYSLGVEKGLAAPSRTLEDFYSISPKYLYVKDINRRLDTMSNEDFLEVEAHIKAQFHRHNTALPKILKRVVSRAALYKNDPPLVLRDFKKFLAWVR